MGVPIWGSIPWSDPEFTSSDSGGGAPGGANRFSDVSLNGPAENQ